MKYDKVIQYNKLVRDKVIDNLKAQGIPFKAHAIEDQNEYWQKLKAKLREEVDEFVEEETEEEIADILEVIEAICKEKGFNMVDIEHIKAKRAEEKGKFNLRINLDES
jgi:predicted house-cleaning noncanonical NTP pyrophosphatase (MazG superfamily)